MTRRLGDPTDGWEILSKNQGEVLLPTVAVLESIDVAGQICA